MDKKLNILCLHGYRQNSDKFRSQTGALRKVLKNHADFVFISAPHKLEEEEGDQRSWWFTKVKSFSSEDETDEDTGFGESLNLLKEVVKERGPFHGILGFSQGAALAALIAAFNKSETFIDVKFIIIISGFISKCRKHLQFYPQTINIPSLHVIGETDQVINKERSLDLAKLFFDPVIIMHEGGHFISCISSVKNKYLNFILAQKHLVFNESCNKLYQ